MRSPSFRGFPQVVKKHQCVGRKDGDWIKYFCPDCEYELWDNMETGELRIFNDHHIHIQHSGFYAMPEFVYALENRN